MKPILSERNLVVFLFVMVLVTFAMAQEDSRKMELVEVAAKSTSPNLQLANQGSSSQKNATPDKSQTAVFK
jgi:hypothetical protein